MKDLLSKGETLDIKRFNSKSGKTFNSKLVINNGSMEFKVLNSSVVNLKIKC